MNNVNIDRHIPEISRALRNGKFDEVDNGLLLPAQGLVITSSITTKVNGRDPMTTHNKFTLEGRRYLWRTGLTGTAQYSSWYLAPFTNSVAVADGWTAANFASTAGEFSDYDGATRPQWNGVIHATASSGSNAASPAQITISAGVSNLTIRGWGVLSSGTKSGTTGVLLAALRNDRAGLGEGDTLSAEYSLVFQDAA